MKWMHAYLHTLPLHASFLCPNNDIRLYIGKNVQSESLTTWEAKNAGCIYSITPRSLLWRFLPSMLFTFLTEVSLLTSYYSLAQLLLHCSEPGVIWPSCCCSLAQLLMLYSTYVGFNPSYFWTYSIAQLLILPAKLLTIPPKLLILTARLLLLA